ncbi:MAG: hypothetical protein WCP07_04575, partial [bacterium]
PPHQSGSHLPCAQNCYFHTILRQGFCVAWDGGNQTPLEISTYLPMPEALLYRFLPRLFG